MYEKLTRKNGAYSLPFLIELSDSTDSTVLRFVDNISDITYEGKEYKASAIEYTPNDTELGFSGGGTLEVAHTGEMIIDLIETQREIKLSVIGVLFENGTVFPIKSFNHRYCKATPNGQTVTFDFYKDDRLEMTFPAITWNTYNNKGNA